MRRFIDALWSPAWKGLTSWLSFVMSNCEVATFPLVSCVRCGAGLYPLLILALFLTFYQVGSNNAIGTKNGPAQGQMAYIGLYRENMQKSFSSETTSFRALIFGL